ncbi:unnamed protein product [Psylliodes chrysocephalus]|uniref:Glutaredoxin domain-containing protein n=1 Tax=Psylliodes chrysocephalus TaxID=3402493 RepID=A0A9P0G6R7_9CUCU|nr:unnamed protein product [Psylliodes chrysocephala]
MWERFLNFLCLKAVSFGNQDLNTEKVVQVQNMVNCDNIVIFTKSYCTYCKLALDILDRCGARYTEIVLDRRDDGEEIQRILGELTGSRTVPRIFINNTCLGGCTECKRLFETGELQKLIIQACC